MRSGEFPSYYQLLHIDNEWRYHNSSPFITASLLAAIDHLEGKQAEKIRANGCQFLLDSMEKGGYWRFWKHEQALNPVPFDMDDTALASWVLTRNGIKKFNNKMTIFFQQNIYGDFYTWILPRPQLAVNPKLLYYTFEDYEQIEPTLYEKMLDQWDSEPAVAAHVLLYLGQSIYTARNTGRLVQIMNNPDINLQFYYHQLFAYYHLARAYTSGCTGLQKLIPVLQAKLDNWKKTEWSDWNIVQKSIFVSILFKFRIKDIEKYYSILYEYIQLTKSERVVECLPYFTSKSRLFFGGSPELTRAFVLEAWNSISETAWTEVGIR